MARPMKGEEQGWKKAFLAALATRPQVSYACRASGVARSTAYRAYNKAELDTTDDFNERWNEAMEEGLDLIEEDLAKLGRGEQKGSAVALIYLLNNRRYQIRNGSSLPSKLILEWGE